MGVKPSNLVKQKVFATDSQAPVVEGLKSCRHAGYKKNIYTDPDIVFEIEERISCSVGRQSHHLLVRVKARPPVHQNGGFLK